MALSLDVKPLRQRVKRSIHLSAYYSKWGSNTAISALIDHKRMVRSNGFGKPLKKMCSQRCVLIVMSICKKNSPSIYITIITRGLTKVLVGKHPLNLTKTVNELPNIYNPELVSGSYGITSNSIIKGVLARKVNSI